MIKLTLEYNKFNGEKMEFSVKLKDESYYSTKEIIDFTLDLLQNVYAEEAIKEGVINLADELQEVTNLETKAPMNEQN